MEKFLLQLELQDLQTRYISAIDDGRFEEWPDFFTPDATYEILPRENVNQGLPAGVMLCFSQAMMRDRVVSMRSEEHTSELQSLMRNSYAVFCLKKKQSNIQYTFR